MQRHYRSNLSVVQVNMFAIEGNGARLVTVICLLYRRCSLRGLHKIFRYDWRVTKIDVGVAMRSVTYFRERKVAASPSATRTGLFTPADL